MNLRDLQYLVALADHQHFGHAAAASFVSQPTLSTQIKKLEEELGVALVERTPRKVLLTEVGAQVAAHARGVLRAVREIKDTAKRSKNPLAGTLRLGFFPTLGPYLLPHLVAKFRQALPDIELLLSEEKTAVLLEQLNEGQLDAAALALPIDDERLHREFLFEEHFVLAVPRGHPLAKQRTVSLEQLADQRLLLLEDGHCLRDQALEVCHRAGAGEREGFRATSLETLRQMVAANMGVTLLPALAVKPPVARSRHVVLLRFRDAKPSRRIALVWRRTATQKALLLKVAGMVRELPRRLLLG